LRKKVTLRLPDEQLAESSGLGSLLLALANKAARAAEEEGPKGSSFPTYLLLAGLVVLGFAIMGWMAVRASRKAAQLEYKLRLQEEDKKRAQEAATLNKNAVRREDAEVVAQNLEASIQALQGELAAIKDEAAERARVLASAASWGDISVVSATKRS
jgi:uncharacterized protein HemX